MIRLAIRLAVVAVAGIAVYLGVTFVQVWQTAQRDGARPAQAIVVLGAAQYNGRPSAVLRARLDHAYDLWRRDLAPVIVVTGGRVSGDRFTEAGVSATYLHRLGVRDDAILREASGRTSWESLAASSRFLHERHLTDVLLVSDPFHSARIAAIARELDLHGSTSPTRTSPIKGTDALRHMVHETGIIALSRIIGYGRLVRVDKARPVPAAAARLVCCPAPSGVV